MFEFPTQEWFRALVDAINGSEAYREAAADWEGDIAFVIEADPDEACPTTSGATSTCGTGRAATAGS